MWTRLGAAERRVRAIDFDHEIEGTPSYCLPSLAAFDARGRLLLGDAALKAIPVDGLGSALTRFKMLVAGKADSAYLDEWNQARFLEHVRRATGDESNCTVEMLTTTFLAFVMRRVRRILEKELETADLNISFNTCVPVDQRENNAVFDSYRRIVNAAELLERSAQDDSNGRAWLDKSNQMLKEAYLPEEETRLFVVPEALAGSAAYIASLQRASGLHALVDIGAGTTDVSIFNLSLGRRHGVKSYWYSARSVPYGAGHIELRLDYELRKSNGRGGLSRIRRVLSGQERTEPTSEIINSELDNIRRATAPAWAEAYSKFKGTSNWKGEKVRVFISGGGSLIQGATTVFSEAWTSHLGPYPCERLPDPETYVSARVGGPFARLSVAYGLTTPIPELGDYALPSEVKDHTPPKPPTRAQREEGDQLLPTWDWC